MCLKFIYTVTKEYLSFKKKVASFSFAEVLPWQYLRYHYRKI